MLLWGVIQLMGMACKLMCTQATADKQDESSLWKHQLKYLDKNFELSYMYWASDMTVVMHKAIIGIHLFHCTHKLVILVRVPHFSDYSYYILLFAFLYSCNISLHSVNFGNTCKVQNISRYI